MKYNDTYDFENCLMAWFYGMSPEDAEKESWTPEEMQKAENYMIQKHVDPVDYCNEYWN